MGGHTTAIVDTAFCLRRPAASAPCLEGLNCSYCQLLTDEGIRPYIWASAQMRWLNLANCRKRESLANPSLWNSLGL